MLTNMPRTERRALVGALRDSLTPMCTEFANAVRAKSPEEVVELAIGDMKGMVEHRCNDRRGSGGKFEQMEARLRYFRTFHVSMPVDDSGPLLVHVGEYGPELARRILLAERALIRVAESDEGERITRNPVWNALLYGQTELKSPVGLFMDGLFSVGQAFEMLTASTVKGFNGYMDLMETLAAQQFPSRLAIFLTFGMMADLRSSEAYIPGIVNLDGNGQLRFGQGFVREINAVRPLFLRLSSMRSNAIGMGCPVGKPVEKDGESGLEVLTDAFMHVFRRLDDAKISSVNVTRCSA